MFPIKSNSPDPVTFTQKPLNSEFAKEFGFLCGPMLYPLQEVDFHITIYAPENDTSKYLHSWNFFFIYSIFALKKAQWVYSFSY